MSNNSWHAESCCLSLGEVTIIFSINYDTESVAMNKKKRRFLETIHAMNKSEMTINIKLKDN